MVISGPKLETNHTGEGEGVHSGLWVFTTRRSPFPVVPSTGGPVVYLAVNLRPVRDE